MRDEKDDTLKKRLDNYREDPDEGSWDRIASALSQQDGLVQNRLKNYAEEPREAAWESINTQLNSLRVELFYARANRLITYLTLLLLLVIIYPGKDDATGIQSGVVKSEVVARRDVEKLDTDSVDVSKNNVFNSKSIGGNKMTSTSNESGVGQNEVMANRSSGKRNQSTISHSLKADASTLPGRARKNKSRSVINIHAERKQNSNESNPSAVERSNAHDQPLTPYIIPSVSQNEKDVKTTPASVISAENLSLKIDSVIAKVDSIKKEVPSVVEPAEAKKDERKKVAGSGFYFLIMPTFGYQNVDPIKSDNIFVQSLQKVSAFSLDRLGVRAEVGWEKKMSNRISTNIGMLYYQRKQTITYSYLDPNHNDFSAEPVPLTYNTNPNSLTSTFEYELKNIGVVVGMNYYLNRGKFDHRIGAGVEIHKGLSKADESLPPGNSIYVFGNAYYRMAYHLSTHFDFIAQPTFNYSFKAADQLNAPFYVKPYGLGLSVGVYYKIGSFK